MAFSVIDTHIQNPARAGKGKRNMAKSRRKMSAKQIKHFGTKRQKAALKASRTRHRTRTKPTRRRNPPKGGGRVISGYGSTVMNPRRKRNPGGSHKIVINSARKRRKKSTVKRRKNPELVSFLLGNPAKRSTKGMARSRKKTRRAASHRSNAGTRRRRVNRAVHHRRRRNPGMTGAIGSPQTWLMGGAGVLAGFVGSSALPQMVLGAGNTGMAGYAATAAAAIGLAFLAHMFVKKPAVTGGVVAGGFANLLRKIISDQTPFGSYLSMSGMGDYMVANWGPPRMNNGLFSAMAEAPGTPWGGPGSGGGMITSSGVGIQDMADIRSARPC